MDTQNKLKEIEATDYWDAQILDINTRFLGDELSLYIASYEEEDKDKFCWEIKFLQCYKVEYETDAKREMREKPVKEYRGAQLYGYVGQDIKLVEYEGELYDCQIVLANMGLRIICQDIDVSKVLIDEQHFFWKDK